MFNTSTSVLALFVAGLVGLACSRSGLKTTADAGAASGGRPASTISSGTTGGTGGIIGPGGAGGGRIGGAGGATSSTIDGTGGAISSGGSNRGGGTAGTSGTGGTGGSSATGGTLNIGGTSGSGGVASGGAPGAGGSSVSGGALSTGGTANTGGYSATGGASSTCGNAVLPPGGLCSGFRWVAGTSANSITLYFGNGTTFPEYVAIDTCSSYTRFVYGPLGGWGSSVILAPVFWTADGLQQVSYIDTQININCDQILILLTGTLAGLSFSGTLNIDPPANNKLTAHVSMTTSGTVTLATDRPWEAFKPVTISTMYESSTVWDADYATIGSDTYPLPTSGWVVAGPVATTHLGVMGGSSSWKTNAPTVVIDLAGVSSPLVTGWMTQSADPNDDNGSLWAATTEVQSSWNYDITVSQ